MGSPQRVQTRGTILITQFAPGEERKVSNSVSEECQIEDCERCLGLFQRDDYPGQTIFCVHPCHRAANQGN
jgi:hypothetical protein